MCAWWQLIETWKKLVLVGFFALLQPGTVLQVISAFLVSAIFGLLVGIAAPYKDASDDYFAKTCSFALTILFFFVTVLKMGVLAEQLDSVMTDELRYRFSFDAGLVSAGMVASIVGILPLAVMIAARRLFQATQVGEAARRSSEESSAASTERAESSINPWPYSWVTSLRPRSTRRSVARGACTSQERSSGPRHTGSALGTRAKGLNLKRALSLRMTRTHRNFAAQSAKNESEAAVHAENAPCTQGRPSLAAPLPSRHDAKLRASVLENLLRVTRACQCSGSTPRVTVSGASTNRTNPDDDRPVRV